MVLIVCSYIYKQNNKIDKLFMFEDIPREKLQNAISSFAHTLSADETVIFLYDDTIRGSSKQGILLTTKYLYCESDVVSIPNINKMEIKYGKVTAKIVIDMQTRSDMIVHIAQMKKPAESLFNLLNEAVHLLKKEWEK